MEHYAKRAAQTFNAPDTDENGNPDGPGLEELVAQHDQLQGLADDDHAQYLKEKASGGLASEVPEHDHTTAAQAGVVTGLGHTIQDDNSNMTARGNLSFQDGLVLRADSAGNQTEVDLSYAGTGDIANISDTEAAGSALTVARGDHVHDLATDTSDLEFSGGSLRNRFIGARVYNSASQSINNNTLTALNFDSERYDSDALHDTATNNTRLTVPVAGVYHVGCFVNFAADVDGRRVIRLLLNGTTVIGNSNYHPTQEPTFGTNVPLSTDWSFAANDYVELHVLHTAGAALNVDHAGFTEFWIHRIAGT